MILITFALILACFALSTLAYRPMHQLMPKVVHDAHIKCLKQLDIVLPNKPPEVLSDETLSKLACLDRCILTDLNVIDADGVYHHLHAPAELADASQKCFESLVKLDSCEKAHNFSVCTFRASLMNLQHIILECANETRTDLSELMSGGGQNDGNDSGGHHGAQFEEVLKNDGLACLHRCIMIKMHKIDDGGELLLENLMEYAPDGVDMESIVESCTSENKQEEVCLKAVRRGLCVLQGTRNALHKE